MKYLALFAVIVAVATAFPFEILEDEDGEEYFLVPLNREKRDTKWGASGSGASISHQGTIANSNGHRLDGTVSAQKNFGSHGLRPDQAGGRLDYSGGRTSGFASADHARGYGTDVNAGVRHNVYQNRNFGVDVTGQYGRHYGGPSGTGRPNAGVGVVGHGRF